MFWYSCCFMYTKVFVMGMMSMTVGLVCYVLLSFAFIVSCSSICYELSPYSRRGADVSLPEWERKTLYTIAGYPPLSLLLLAIIGFVLTGDTAATIPALQFISWYCIGHLAISVIAIVSARYLRERNKRNAIYYFTDMMSGCIYAGVLITIMFLEQQ